MIAGGKAGISGAFLARAIPGAKLMIPHGGGHAFSKTRTEEYNRIVLDFLGAAG